MAADMSSASSPNEYIEASSNAIAATIAELDSEELPNEQSSTMVASVAHGTKNRSSSQDLLSPADVESFIDKLLSIGEANLYHWRLTSKSRILHRTDVPEGLDSVLEAALYGICSLRLTVC